MQLRSCSCEGKNLKYGCELANYNLKNETAFLLIPPFLKKKRLRKATSTASLRGYGILVESKKRKVCV